MGKFWRYYVSYSIWSQTAPAIGKEYWHCDRKRGYSRAKKQEPQIKELVSIDNTPQKIGHLAQRAVYEFHQNTELLSHSDGVKEVAEILQLDNELLEIKARVSQIISNYYNNPILVEKNILKLAGGNEGIPDAVPIKYGNFTFGLYAATDCIVLEPDKTIHIIDFKTGKSDFDCRQAYVYLVVAQTLYPQYKAIASFYNLETQIQSEPISLSQTAIESVCTELFLVAQKLQRDLQKYKKAPQLFNRIFPANPSSSCQYCNFQSICEYATN
ncbi:MAG TPA: PD-(D/E)XK nuclease family protein [Xenococcaceae cyanobacterium]